MLDLLQNQAEREYMDYCQVETCFACLETLDIESTGDSLASWPRRTAGEDARAKNTYGIVTYSELYRNVQKQILTESRP